MTRRSHRGRKGDGWPKRGAGQPVLATVPSQTRAAIGSNVCPQNARCCHVVCSIVWYCVEAVEVAP